MAQECQTGTPLTCHPDNERSHPADTRLKPLLSPCLQLGLTLTQMAWSSLCSLGWSSGSVVLPSAAVRFTPLPPARSSRLFIAQQASHSKDTVSEAKVSRWPAQPGFRLCPLPCVSLNTVSYPGSMLEEEREEAAIGVGIVSKHSLSRGHLPCSICRHPAHMNTDSTAKAH